ncbi:hypothetical protein ACFLZV_00325 [Candidatus Margulisiibacteriota bacterium]
MENFKNKSIKEEKRIKKKLKDAVTWAEKKKGGKFTPEQMDESLDAFLDLDKEVSHYFSRKELPRFLNNRDWEIK